MCKIISLKNRLQSYYTTIHVYRPMTAFIQIPSPSYVFLDVYRHQLYSRELISSIITPVHQKKRCRSCRPIPLLRSFAPAPQTSELDSISISSGILSIISARDDSHTIRDIVAIMEQSGIKQVQPLEPVVTQADNESAVSQNGSEEHKEQTPPDGIGQTRAEQISIMIDYFAKPLSRDAVSNDSFVVISDTSSTGFMRRR